MFSKRAIKLAKIILDHSLEVKINDKLLISASDFSSEELLGPLYTEAIKKGAIVHLDILGNNFITGRADYGDFMKNFLLYANETQLRNTDTYSLLSNWSDKMVRIVSIHDKTFLEKINSDKLTLRLKSVSPISDKNLLKPWCLTYYPTKALAKNAGMTLSKFTDFYFKASNINYKQMDKEILPLQNILDKGKVVQIVGKGIDLKLNIENRLSMGVDNGKHNIPDGECFIGPVEDKTEGYIKFELPQVYNGKEFKNIFLEFKKGKLVKYSSTSNNPYLQNLLNSDEGNKRLGEFGIGMNKNITQYIKDILFDEKIYGTVHFALGLSYPYARGGGKNKASIHWDLIKDLRHKGSLISVDENIIFKDGKHLL